nr:hypothetical protein SEVIR_6G155500v2 [Setaria viridis]
MASFPFPIKPLDGAGGYLRWKESVLLGLHMVDVAHVLSDDPPAPARAGGDGDGAQAAKKWARDDALCCGHILEALSNRLLPVYVRHATGRALWQAVARTYEPHASSLELRFEELEFREDETLMEAGAGGARRGPGHRRISLGPRQHVGSQGARQASVRG